MRSKYTPEELYQAYAPDVFSYMVNDLGIPKEEARRIFRITQFKKHFIENTSDYDFAEPEEVAKDMIRSLQPKRRRRDGFRTTSSASSRARVIRGPKKTVVRIARADHQKNPKTESSSFSGPLYSK